MCVASLMRQSSRTGAKHGSAVKGNMLLKRNGADANDNG